MLVVVDNCADSPAAAALRDLHPRMLEVRRPSNPGFAAGCNAGAAAALAAGAQHLWFLNNDACLVQPVLPTLLQAAGSFPQVALWGTHQLTARGELGADHHGAWYDRGGAAALPLGAGMRQLGGRESLSGASIFVTRPFWERLGPWPEDYFLYWEDAAWCARAHAQRLPVVLLDIGVRHERGTTSGRHSPMTLFYGSRNMLLLHAQLHPRARLRRLALALYVLQRRLFRGQLLRLRPLCRGIAAGLRGRRGRDPRY